MATPFDPKNSSQYAVGIGVDEVGRGCLVSCAVVSAVWFDPAQIPPSLLGALDDSKRLSAKKREELAVQIHLHCRVAYAAASTRLIEKLNIRGATLDAMRRAVERLALEGHVYIDGRDVPPGLNREATAVIKGDQTIPQIAAASIVAKTLRDGLLVKLDRRHPGYAWATNAGYGTKAHYEALRSIGITAHHRPSFLKSLKEG